MITYETALNAIGELASKSREAGQPLGSSHQSIRIGIVKDSIAHLKFAKHPNPPGQPKKKFVFFARQGRATA